METGAQEATPPPRWSWVSREPGQTPSSPCPLGVARSGGVYLHEGPRGASGQAPGCSVCVGGVCAGGLGFPSLSHILTFQGFRNSRAAGAALSSESEPLRPHRPAAGSLRAPRPRPASPVEWPQGLALRGTVWRRGSPGGGGGGGDGRTAGWVCPAPGPCVRRGGDRNVLCASPAEIVFKENSAGKPSCWAPPGGLAAR